MLGLITHLEPRLKKKVIIGFIGEDGVGKTTASNILAKEGFYKTSITTKVIEFASYLFSEEEIASNRETILKEVKKRGNSTYGRYWLNLVLMAIPENKNLIVIDDLGEEDIQTCTIVQPIEIIKDKQSPKDKDRMVIENSGDLKAFKEKVKMLAKKLS